MFIRTLGHLSKSKYTDHHYANEISDEFMDYKIRHIAQRFASTRDYGCFIVGMGGQYQRVYRQLAETDGVCLIWSGSLLPGYLTGISGLLPCHSGIVRIEQAQLIQPVFARLTNRAMAGIYIFPESFAFNFISIVRSDPLCGEAGFGINVNKDYFYYIVDADRPRGKNGLHASISCGVDSPFA